MLCPDCPRLGPYPGRPEPRARCCTDPLDEVILGGALTGRETGIDVFGIDCAHRAAAPQVVVVIGGADPDDTISRPARRPAKPTPAPRLSLADELRQLAAHLKRHRQAARQAKGMARHV